MTLERQMAVIRGMIVGLAIFGLLGAPLDGLLPYAALVLASATAMWLAQRRLSDGGNSVRDWWATAQRAPLEHLAGAFSAVGFITVIVKPLAGALA